MPIITRPCAQKRSQEIARPIIPAALIVYGVTVPKIAEHPDMGIAFVQMLIGPDGQAILTADGQPPVVLPWIWQCPGFPCPAREHVNLINSFFLL